MNDITLRAGFLQISSIHKGRHPHKRQPRDPPLGICLDSRSVEYERDCRKEKRDHTEAR
jgi:hypothetical protein